MTLVNSLLYLAALVMRPCPSYFIFANNILLSTYNNIFEKVFIRTNIKAGMFITLLLYNCIFCTSFAALSRNHSGLS